MMVDGVYDDDVYYDGDVYDV